MDIAIVTPTGDRPKSLLRQARYLRRSLLPETEIRRKMWVIVDDGVAGFPSKDIDLPGWTIVYERPQPVNDSSMLRNLVHGLNTLLWLNPDVILFWEDDDWYAPSRALEHTRKLQAGIHMHGMAHSLYYHVPSRQWRRMANRTPSLFETAFSKEILRDVILFTQSATGDGRGFDTSLWRKFDGPCRSQITQPNHAIGIKGMPGRGGIGCGHRPSGSGWTSDITGEWLASQVGEIDAMEIFEEGGRDEAGCVRTMR